jgi:nitrogen regulatory protein P-II 1
MKKIEVIIRPENLEPLKEALLSAKVDGLTINQVLGCGKQYGWTEHHRGSDILMNTIPKIEIKMITVEERVEEIISIVFKICQSGELGDGKIFISDVSECIHIRTGERGVVAI